MKKGDSDDIESGESKAMISKTMKSDFFDIFKQKKKKSKIKFLSQSELNDYKSLKDALSKGEVKKENITSIVKHMFQNRQSMSNVVTIPMYFYAMIINWFPCCLNKKKKDDQVIKKDLRLARIFKKAKKRYFDEMDVLNIVRNARMMRVWMSIMLNRRQTILLHY